MMKVDHAVRLLSTRLERRVAPRPLFTQSDTSESSALVMQLEPVPRSIPTLQALHNELSQALHRIRRAYQMIEHDLRLLLNPNTISSPAREISPMILQPLAAATAAIRITVDHVEHLPLQAMPMRYPLLVDIHYLEQMINQATHAIWKVAMRSTTAAGASAADERVCRYIEKVVTAYNDVLIQVEALIEQSSTMASP